MLSTLQTNGAWNTVYLTSIASSHYKNTHYFLFYELQRVTFVKILIYCYLYGIFNVHKPAIKFVILCDVNQLIGQMLPWFRVFQKLTASLNSIFIFCDYSAQHWNAMGVCSIGPTWRRYGNKMMTEVHKCVNQLPVVYNITVIWAHTLDKSVKKTNQSSFWVDSHLWERRLNDSKLVLNNDLSTKIRLHYLIVLLL